jgi:hypothetical protein
MKLGNNVRLSVHQIGSEVKAIKGTSRTIQLSTVLANQQPAKNIGCAAEHNGYADKKRLARGVRFATAKSKPPAPPLRPS